jgi:ferredoxin-NADP reductase
VLTSAQDRSLPEAEAVAAHRATTWTDGRIIEKELPTPMTVRLRMHVDQPTRHRLGQHYLIRLRALHGYTAQRPYSLASDPEDPLLEFLVERQPDGEVSEFLADVAEELLLDLGVAPQSIRVERFGPANEGTA